MKLEEGEIKTNKEKIQKKFKIAKFILTTMESMILIGVILFVILMAIIPLMIMVTSFEKVDDVEIVEEMDTDEDSLEDLIISAGIGIRKDGSLLTDFVEQDYEQTKLVESIFWIVLFILDGICAFLVIDKLRKVCVEVEKSGTPFCEKSVKEIVKVNKLVTILFLLGVSIYRVRIIPYIIICVITEVFKHGYELQNQVDETL